MLFYLFDNVENQDVERDTLSISYNIQRRSNSCTFTVLDNPPEENDDLRIYNGGFIKSVNVNDVVVEGYEKNVNTFRAGQIVFTDLGEKRQVVTVDESTDTITLDDTVTGAWIGEIIFGGVVARVQDQNLYTLNNIIYAVTGVSYDKLFDKKLITDAYLNVDSRYIINSFINRFVNLNRTIDDLSFVDNTAIQAEITEGGDSEPPVVSSDKLEGINSANLSWVNSGGTATFEASPSNLDLSELLGTTTGTPTQGEMMLWLKTSAPISNLSLRIGSDDSNYTEIDFELRNTTEWQYLLTKMTDGTTVGTPDWTDVQYWEIIIDQTADGSVLVNGLRLNQSRSFTLFNVSSTIVLDEFRIPALKPTAVMQQLAKAYEFTWFIDFEKDIHFVNKSLQPSFYTINSSSSNFFDLRVETDASQQGNRVIISGGERQAVTFAVEHFRGDDVRREWVIGSKFGDLSVLIDDNSATQVAGAGTNTTTIDLPAHGLSDNDSITNRTRGAVRQVAVVDPDTIQVSAIDGQTSGDTISFFTVAKTTGIEGIVDPATVDYVFNSNSQSIKATDGELTLTDNEYIRFQYRERVPLRLQYTDSGSVANLRAKGLGDGIIDLDPIRDNSLDDDFTAQLLAQAKVNEYTNPVIMGSFTTDFNGFKVGDLVDINLGSRIDNQYVIQSISARQVAGEFGSYFNFAVTFGTTMFGVIEFYQKLLQQGAGVQGNVDATVELFQDAQETIVIEDEWNFVKYDQNWQYEPSVGQPVPSQYNLAQYG